MGAGIAYPVVRTGEVLYKKLVIRGARLIGLREKSIKETVMKEHHRNLKIETLYAVFDDNKNLLINLLMRKRMSF